MLISAPIIPLHTPQHIPRLTPTSTRGSIGARKSISHSPFRPQSTLNSHPHSHAHTHPATYTQTRVHHLSTTQFLQNAPSLSIPSLPCSMLISCYLPPQDFPRYPSRIRSIPRFRLEISFSIFLSFSLSLFIYLPTFLFPSLSFPPTRSQNLPIPIFPPSQLRNKNSDT